MQQDLLRWMARGLGIIVLGMVLYPMMDGTSDRSGSGMGLSHALICTIIINLSLWVSSPWLKNPAIIICVFAWMICLVEIVLGQNILFSCISFTVSSILIWVNLRERVQPPPLIHHILRFSFSIVTLWLGISCFFLPGIEAARELCDFRLFGSEIPQVAWQIHAELGKELADRLDRQINSREVTNDEFEENLLYLRSIEALEEAWKADHSLASDEPTTVAARAEADCVELVLKQKYQLYNPLAQRFRFLYISTLTAHIHLTGDMEEIDLLRDQVDGVSKSIDASYYGLLSDEHDEFHPWREVSVLAAIHQADPILKTDHSAILERAQRGFTIGLLPNQVWLPFRPDPPDYYSDSGYSIGLACIDAEEIWPDLSSDWYHQFEEKYWHEHWGAVGFSAVEQTRRKRASIQPYDSDTILTFGLPASELGLGAARVHGRFDQAGPLAAELVLMAPQLSLDDRIRLLYGLTRVPPKKAQPAQAVFTLAVYLGLVIYFGGALVLALPAIHFLRQCRK